MNSTDFGKKVATLRKEKGLTQSELAEKLNISNKAISRWETGEGYPEITILTSLAKELGVTVDELLNYSQAEAGISKGFTEEVHEEFKNNAKKVRTDILVTKPYMKSLTIFNKIGATTIIINLTAILFYVLCIIMSIVFNGLPAFFFVPVIIYGVAMITGKVGLIATVIGLIAGLLDLYDRQIKASVIIALILFAATYILPLILVSSSMIVV